MISEISKSKIHQGSVNSAILSKLRKQKRIDEHKQNCLHCNKSIHYNNRRNKFCSKSCGGFYNSENNKNLNRRKPEGNCRICNVQITTSRVYCSPCYKKNLKIKSSIIIDTNSCIKCNKDLPRQKIAFCSTQCRIELENEITTQSILNGSCHSPQKLRKWMLKNNPHECSICLTKEWNGQVVPLTMDHIDGHSENNLRDNLRLICPNCDALLPTFKARNRGNGRASRRQRYADGKSY